MRLGNVYKITYMVAKDNLITFSWLVGVFATVMKARFILMSVLRRTLLVNEVPTLVNTLLESLTSVIVLSLTSITIEITKLKLEKFCIVRTTSISSVNN